MRKQHAQLWQRILQWGSREQEAVGGLILLELSNESAEAAPGAQHYTWVTQTAGGATHLQLRFFSRWLSSTTMYLN